MVRSLLFFIFGLTKHFHLISNKTNKIMSGGSISSVNQKISSNAVSATDDVVRTLLHRMRRKLQFLTKPETPRSRSCMFYTVTPPRGVMNQLRYRVTSRLPASNDAALSVEEGGMTSIFPTGADGPENHWQLIAKATSESRSADAAVGAMIGLVMGDAFGAPLEFLGVRCDPKLLELPQFRGETTSSSSPTKGHSCLNLTPNNVTINNNTHSSQASRSVLNPKDVLQFHKPCNKFQLRLGQWTDDASMALCLADSLIVTALQTTTTTAVHEKDDNSGVLPTTMSALFHDGDCRVRYCNWWFHGYNNAFRFDRSRKDSHGGLGGTSVGLGGNISASLYALQAAALASAPKEDSRLLATRKRSRDDDVDDEDAQIHFSGDNAAKHPFVPDDENSHDSGNGSLMRLAPAALRCWSDPALAQSLAETSSYTTHGGEEAAAACRFVSYFISRAVGEAAAACDTDKRRLGISHFLDGVIAEFIAEVCRRGEESGPPYKRLLSLLRSQPPSPKEACWNWKAREIAVSATLVARGDEYQGYPVSYGYFGSYALDGLAMALWAMHEEVEVGQEGGQPHQFKRTFLSVLFRVVNLLGDCDSTGAITCQMAGAFFGYRHIAGIADLKVYGNQCGGSLGSNDMTSSPSRASCRQQDAEGESLVLKTMLACVKTWDPLGEIGVRGVLLHHLGRGNGTTDSRDAAVS
ncbi:ADP-ribosylglycohydrolase, putative [Bodo saltans]|uniref:ADP-ribosylglycohydrolase, putative n=1 Tax=Bodo saltans TaxID=75058 RepID=A0A0S4IQS5_BODSA|nr:ADP-ribosylglycohydrolase, putative [Bodo saltans]|eukprot:CUE73805.1 ADP-ribosylglycohydrolase, putative [Bodo saltans]